MEYGVGLIGGQQLDENILQNRPRHIRGRLTIDGTDFPAASGSGRYYGCPYGTYTLSIQSVGSTIARLYRRFGIGGPGFEHVWNVGQPEDITGTGFDPAAGRERHAIQVHCDPNMVSMGCIVMDAEQFPAFAACAKEMGELAIEVAPIQGSQRVSFRVFQRTNGDAVSQQDGASGERSEAA